MSEIELKFGVDAKRAAAIDAALRRLPSRRISIESRYFDSDDFCLARAGLSLRLRRTGRLWEQTLKARMSSVVERLEETVPRPGRWGKDGPALAPELHDGTAAGKLLRSARAHAETPVALRHVCTSDIVRRSVEIAAGDARVEVAFDHGVIRAGADSTPVCEVEYELKQGDATALLEFGRAGVREHGLWLSTLSKAARGDRLARSEAQGPAVKASAPRLDRKMPGPMILRAVLKSCLDQVLGNASELAAGHLDAEAVHQLRVGLRRMRTAWRELGPLAGRDDSAWERPLTDAFRALGDYRDLNTVVDSLRSRLAEAGSPEPTLRTPTQAVADPVQIVRAKGFQCALLDVLALTFGTTPSGVGGAVAPAVAKGTREAQALGFVGSRLGVLHGHLEHGAKTFRRASHEAQHRVRKRFKRLRYLAELVASLYPASRVDRYLDALRPAQDALGTHVDLLVGLGIARAAALGGDANAWFNVGWLTAQLEASARRCGKALARAAKATPFWKRHGR